MRTRKQMMVKNFNRLIEDITLQIAYIKNNNDIHSIEKTSKLKVILKGLEESKDIIKTLYIVDYY